MGIAYIHSWVMHVELWKLKINFEFVHHNVIFDDINEE